MNRTFPFSSEIPIDWENELLIVRVSFCVTTGSKAPATATCMDGSNQTKAVDQRLTYHDDDIGAGMKVHMMALLSQDLGVLPPPPVGQISDL
jgi:hypothetical protein